MRRPLTGARRHTAASPLSTSPSDPP
jgi:hypothetical protein